MWVPDQKAAAWSPTNSAGRRAAGAEAPDDAEAGEQHPDRGEHLGKPRRQRRRAGEQGPHRARQRGEVGRSRVDEVAEPEAEAQQQPNAG